MFPVSFFLEINSHTSKDQVRYQKKQPVGFWAKREIRRKFLIAFAEKMGFDPTVPSNWIQRKYQLQANRVRSASKL